MIFTVDAEIQRKGGAFVMPELYGAALSVCIYRMVVSEVLRTLDSD